MKFNATQIAVLLSLTVITDEKLSIFTIFNFAKLLLVWDWLTTQIKRVDNWLLDQAEKLAHSVLSFNRGPVWWAIG